MAYSRRAYLKYTHTYIHMHNKYNKNVLFGVLNLLSSKRITCDLNDNNAMPATTTKTTSRILITTIAKRNKKKKKLTKKTQHIKLIMHINDKQKKQRKYLLYICIVERKELILMVFVASIE